MNIEEARHLAVVTSAYTGTLCAPVLSEMHEYIEKILGRPVFTHELASDETTKEIKAACKEEFIRLWAAACDYEVPVTT